MLLQELREIKSGRHERHQFGLVIAGALFLLGLFLAWRREVYPGIFLAALIVIAPVVADKLLKTDLAIVLLPFQKVWMGIAVVLGYFVSRIVLGMLFFGVFSGIRAVNALIGKPLLEKAPDRGGCESYWISRPREGYSPERSEKQY